ncbi:MAG TPA: hypothetical protein VKD08_16205 [Ignavibacteriaceae bacterium]|jgi:hypothetical protein|nr:hypothetical protein [Ignavibacteriaceae bacterium]
MRKIKIALGFIIPDIGGIAAVSIPLALFLSFTNFFADTSGLTPLMIAFLLLILLSLFILPFRLMLIGADLLNIELDKYGIYSVAIIGGLTGGCLFYFIVLSRFSLEWVEMLDYALFGVIQSIIVQIIYNFIPVNWKLQPAE